MFVRVHRRCSAVTEVHDGVERHPPYIFLASPVAVWLDPSQDVRALSSPTVKTLAEGVPSAQLGAGSMARPV